jgi:hypothetical protein
MHPQTLDMQNALNSEEIRDAAPREMQMQNS